MSDAVGTSMMNTPPQPGSGGDGKERSASLWADARRELIRNPVFVASMFVIIVIASMAFVPRLWTSTSPEACDVTGGMFRVPPPWWPFKSDHKHLASWDHPMGVGSTGCDYYSHLIYGAEPSLRIAFFAVVGTVLVGGLLGMLAGFFGGWVDAVISRVTDMFLGLPFLVGALVVLSVFSSRSVEGRIWMISFVLVVLGWTTYARVMRGSVIEARNQDYVAAARSLGAKNSRLMFRHILPNAMAPSVVIATIAFGSYVAVEAVLTFLGAGLQEPAVSWGVMINTETVYAVDEPWLLLIPASLLIATVMSFILAGDALRDALDPKLR